LRRSRPQDQDPFHEQRTNVTAFQALGAFRRQDPAPAPHAGGGVRAQAATGTLVLPPKSPASDMRSRAFLPARPTRRAGYSPERVTHMPPVDFCNCHDPRARLRAAQTPITWMQWQATARSGAPIPCETATAVLSQPRGHTDLHPCNTCPTTTRRADLPQPGNTTNTPCRETDAQLCLEKLSRGTVW
jgi:hypothetical protein